MSDYMFMLESHLTAAQNRVIAQVRQAATDANLNLFLTGGAMRDMLGGFPIRDLDFTVEGQAVRFARMLAQTAGAALVHTDEHRGAVDLLFPGGVTVEVAMARQERYTKPGAKPQVVPATMHQDLLGRDFTVNAIALSLSKASQGLLLDPTNGLADLGHKELRAIGNYTLYDDPSRLLRLIRFRSRLGFQIAERTQQQYTNARQAKLEEKITAPALQHELHQIALEASPADVLRALEEEKLLGLFSPALAGVKLNLPGFVRLQKARQVIPFGLTFAADDSALFFFLLLERLTPRERKAMTAKLGIPQAEVDAALKLEQRARKVEREVGAPNLQRPSALFVVASKAAGELILFLLMRSSQRLVIDRIKNYLQKYLPAALEISDDDVVAKGGVPGTPKFAKVRQQLIAARLDARPKKIVPVEAPAPPPGPPGRRVSSFGR